MKDKRLPLFWGMYIFFSLFIFSAAIDWQWGILMFKFFAILMFGLFLFRKEGNDSLVCFEKMVLLFVGALFSFAMLLRGKMQGYCEIFNIICGILLIILALIYFVKNRSAINIREWIISNKIILLVILGFVVLTIDVWDSWLMWDSWQYYNGIVNCFDIFDADFSGVYNLYLAGHTSLGYSLWVILFQLIKEGKASVQIADIILASISIFAFYQIVRKFLNKKYSNTVLALLSIPYVVSPFVMGIIGNINLDSAVMYFAVIFIACSLYHYECLELVMAFMFCFSKETAVVYYVAYILAKVVCDYMVEHKFSMQGLIKFGFGNIKNYIYAIPAVLWLVLYKLNENNWTGEIISGFNCFGIDSENILLKLKQIFFLNFNWIFWIAIIAGFSILSAKKINIEKKTLKQLIPICIMGFSIIIVNLVYITYVLPRYIVPIIPVLYLTAIVILGNLEEVKYFFSVGVSILLLIQNFYVIDPVMSNIFRSISDSGNAGTNVYLMGNENRFDDHIVYNRQNLYWPEVLKQIMICAGYKGDMLIVRPDYISQYDLFGNDVCFWNIDTREMEYYGGNVNVPENCMRVATYSTSEVQNLKGMLYSDYILYIVPKLKGRDINWDFVSDKKILAQSEITYKGLGAQFFVLEPDCMPVSKGDYFVLPKQDSTLGICTDGENVILGNNPKPLAVSIIKTRYHFLFDEYGTAMDVQYNRVDENGTVWAWSNTGADSQRWLLEKVGDYYMICWYGYALTYDLNDNSIRLTPKTGEDNQLWSFTN